MGWTDEGIQYTAFCQACKLRKQLRGGTRKNRIFICSKCKEAPVNKSPTNLQPPPPKAA